MAGRAVQKEGAKVETTTLAERLADASYGAPVTVEVGEGRRVTLMVDYDDYHSILDDGDWFGLLEWVRRSATWGYEAERPKGFDGNARKLMTAQGDRLWWQPPADYCGDLDDLRRNVVRLLNYGYSVVCLTVEERCECCGLWKETAGDALGGVDLGEWPESRGHLGDVARDMLLGLGVA